MAAAAILKNPKPPYLGRGNSDFNKIKKSKMAAAAIFLKSKNRDISTAVRFDTMT